MSEATGVGHGGREGAVGERRGSLWGVIPAAGLGSRIQPLAFSKELLPVGSRVDPQGEERPRAVSEYLVERMLAAGATKLCFVIAPGKADIIEYYGARIDGADVCYVVQPRPEGLCDSLFRALPWLGEDDEALIGLPDTVWFPRDGLARLGAAEDAIRFLLFEVDRPELFDAVVMDESGAVREIQVKSAQASTRWVWGALRLRAATFRALYTLWRSRQPRDPYLGTLVNAYLAQGGRATASRAGDSYVDVGTLHGYREAVRLLTARTSGLYAPYDFGATASFAGASAAASPEETPK